ncbi:MAG: adenosylmethionine--8-amino-7-oxononanoate transaminase [Armatimonadota bacterium]|nr:adenosylmethionine--8-amino-7-oxononanoate transaminase [Armatimonadota bacterium]
MSNQSYWLRDVRSVWHPYSRIREIEAEVFPTIVRGDGIYLYDSDGNRYIDGISSWWACNLGHGYPRIVEAIRRQAGELQHSMIGGASHPAIIELSELLISACPTGLTRAFFASDGSSAVEAAIKIAVQYWRNIGRPERTGFASLEAGYHGDTLGAVSAGMIETFHSPYRALLFEVHRAKSPYCYRCPEGKEPAGCLTECFSSMETIIEEHHAELAAVIVEPLNQAGGGMRVYPAEYVAKLKALCGKHEVLLIADEIAMGYGRSGRMWACDHASVAPDILCLGKGMAAGYLPISATVVTDEIYSSFIDTPEEDRTFYHGHTFSGNPIAAAAAAETLRVYEDEQILDRAVCAAREMSAQLGYLAALDCVGDTRQIGLVGAIEFVEDKAARTPYPPEKRLERSICMEARRRGALLRPIGSVLYLWPPLITSPEQIRELAAILADSIKSVV